VVTLIIIGGLLSGEYQGIDPKGEVTNTTHASAHSFIAAALYFAIAAGCVFRIWQLRRRSKIAQVERLID